MPQEDLSASTARAFHHQVALAGPVTPVCKPRPRAGTYLPPPSPASCLLTTLQMGCCKTVRVLATKPQPCFLQVKGVSMSCPAGFIFLVLETLSHTPDNVLFCSAAQECPRGRYRPLLRMNHRGVMYLDPCIMTRLNITQLFAKIITPCRPVSCTVQVIRSHLCGRTA